VISPHQVSIGMAISAQPPLRRLTLAVRAARVFGYDAVWTSDHFQGWFPQDLWNRDFSWLAAPGTTPHAYFDYQSLVGYLAPRVGRMQIGVGVTEPLRRHPVLLAQAAMTWSHLTGSSPILGIGAGERENTIPYGIGFDRPVAQLEEALPIVRRCFESRGPFDFAGDFYRLESAMMDLDPAPGRRPQIWIAGHGPRMLRLTGSYGDGWYPTFPMTPAQYAAGLATIRAAARDAGRDPAQIVPGWQMLAVTARTVREARRHLDTDIMRFLALLTPAQLWRDNGLAHPFGESFRGLVDFVPGERPIAEVRAAMAKVPVDIVAENVLWGTAAMVRERIEQYVDVGLRHLVLGPGAGVFSRRSALRAAPTVVRIARAVRRSANARLSRA
jgi:phthiodiolone/phenolphthiodiolone dimycocerosates ketoreductase